jgi:hypothetical protein
MKKNQIVGHNCHFWRYVEIPDDWKSYQHDAPEDEVIEPIFGKVEGDDETL